MRRASSAWPGVVGVLLFTKATGPGPREHPTGVREAAIAPRTGAHCRAVVPNVRPALARPVLVPAFHGVARTFLGTYLELRPEEIRFQLGPYGKPSVVAEQNPEGLSFNMSESQGHALYGITRERAVGVDIERIRDVNNMERIITDTFTPAEQAAFRGLSMDEKRGMFFACWTRKEAFVKAVGLGLSLPLSSFDAPLGGETPAPLSRLDGNVGDASRWTIHPLTPVEGLAGAVAIESPVASLCCRRWPAICHCP